MSSTNAPRWPQKLILFGVFALALVAGGVGYLIGHYTDTDSFVALQKLYAFLKDFGPILFVGGSIGGYFVGALIERVKLQNTFRQKVMELRFNAIVETLDVLTTWVWSIVLEGKWREPDDVAHAYAIRLMKCEMHLPQSIREAMNIPLGLLLPSPVNDGREDKDAHYEMLMSALAQFTTACRQMMFTSERVGSLNLPDAETRRIIDSLAEIGQHSHEWEGEGEVTDDKQ